uniref:EGF-like domain-containing protein n=1 Tax=Parastrongyloides trichosuri TaxID=131310 RepID=A0A0N4Z7Q6_PARTI
MTLLIFLLLSFIYIYTTIGTIIRPLEEYPYNSYSAEAYYDKYCYNNKCGTNGDCIPIVINPKKVKFADEYFCKCKKCYGGTYCDNNICFEDEGFFSESRTILLVITILILILYIIGAWKFVMFYFKFIYGVYEVTRANDDYFIDSIHPLSLLDEERPNIFVLRRPFGYHPPIRSKKNREHVYVLNKKKSVVTAKQLFDDSVSEKSSPNKSVTTNRDQTPLSYGTTNETSDSYGPMKRVLTPYPAKYKMINLVGESNLKKLGIYKYYDNNHANKEQ